ncbi:MAG: hypothetical protein CTY39_01970 [Hyphomicrobium sp.]|nr:MAG: hypothetical protein CTY39_01970 [Hyphomicrobium sp.]
MGSSVGPKVNLAQFPAPAPRNQRLTARFEDSVWWVAATSFGKLWTGKQEEPVVHPVCCVGKNQAGIWKREVEGHEGSQFDAINGVYIVHCIGYGCAIRDGVDSHGKP